MGLGPWILSAISLLLLGFFHLVESLSEHCYGFAQKSDSSTSAGTQLDRTPRFEEEGKQTLTGKELESLTL